MLVRLIPSMCDCCSNSHCITAFYFVAASGVYSFFKGGGGGIVSAKQPFSYSSFLTFDRQRSKN